MPTPALAAATPMAMTMGSFKASHTIVAGSYKRGSSLPRGSLTAPHGFLAVPTTADWEAGGGGRQHVVQHGAVDSDME